MPRAKMFNEEEVLARAMELFWTKGYHATSVQDLVAFLGINRASLYGTYGDKRQLFLKAFALYRAKNTSAVRAFLGKRKSVREGIRALFEQAIDASVNDSDRKGCFVVNTTTELIPGDSGMVDMIRQNQQAFEQIFYEFLETGVQSGEISPGKDLRAIATVLFTLYNGLKVVGKVHTEKSHLMSAVEAVLQLL